MFSKIRMSDLKCTLTSDNQDIPTSSYQMEPQISSPPSRSIAFGATTSLLSASNISDEDDDGGDDSSMPSTMLEALEKQLEKYTLAVEEAQREGDTNKAKRMIQMKKQYEDAIEAHRAGKLDDFGDLDVLASSTKDVDSESIAKSDGMKFAASLDLRACMDLMVEDDEEVDPECGGMSFEDLFSRFTEIKDTADSLPQDQRKAYAEQMVVAFWRAIGGDESEIDGIVESSDDEDKSGTID